MQWTTWTRAGYKAGESSSHEIERWAPGRLANGRAWASRHGERECNTEPMVALSTEVLVIGGGSTGAGVVRDAAMRGFSAMLVERGDLATGTTGRFHGLLHSGGRYVVKDPRSAKECMDENRVLRRIAADCIEDTGGFFVTTPWDDPEYADRFKAGCSATGVDCEEIDPAVALREEPRLNPEISRVFRVPDASIDVWKTVWAVARGA